MGRRMKRSSTRKIPSLGIVLCFLMTVFATGIFDAGSSVRQMATYASEAPSEEWNKTYSLLDINECRCVQQTRDGGYILVVTTVTLFEANVWLVKTDNHGNKIWDKTFGEDDKGWFVRQTRDNGYVIVGVTYEGGNEDVWLIKTDRYGNEEWNKTFGGAGLDGGFCVQETQDGGYIIVGYTYSYGSGSGDVWLIKTDDNGYEQWNKTFGGAGLDRGNYVEQTSDGGFIVVGKKSNDLWLIKTDGGGIKAWDRIFGGDGEDGGTCVRQVSDGYIIVGYTDSFGAGETDAWLIKTDEYGNEEWNRTFGGSAWDEGECIDVTDDGGYIITGSTLSGTDYDAWLIRTDSYGNMKWNSTFGGGNDDFGYSVQQTMDGGYIIGGSTKSFGDAKENAWLIKVAAENKPPLPPAQPRGPTHGCVGNYYIYNTTTIDPNNDLVRYGWDWDGDDIVDEWTGYFASGIVVSTVHSWSEPGIYYVKVKAEDIHGAQSDFSPPLVVEITAENRPPNTPEKPEGPSTGQVDEWLTYSTCTTDPDGDKVRYGWDVNSDGLVDYWSDYYPSGVRHYVNIMFHQPGVYYLRVKAEDVHGAQSDFSPPKQVIITGKNNPPETPSRPSGPTSGVTGGAYTYATSSIDPDGDLIRYGWDWNGDGTIDEWTGYYESGTLVTTTHSWDEPGTYYVRVKTEDEHGAQSDFSMPLVVNIVAGNRPPEKPDMPIGETSGKIFRKYTYSSSTTDPDGDMVYYIFDWGDGTTSGWLGPFESGQTVKASHIWYRSGVYEVRVKAKDIHGAESEWSDPLPITVPRKTPIMSLLEKLLSLLPGYLRDFLSLLNT